MLYQKQEKCEINESLVNSKRYKENTVISQEEKRNKISKKQGGGRRTRD